MKRNLLTVLALSAMFLPGCNLVKDAPAVPEVERPLVSLRVKAGVKDVVTKAETQTAAEKQVNTLDIFVFDTSTEALLFKTRSSSDEVEVSITKGARTFYALVNAPSAASSLSTLSAVAAYHAAFADQGRSSFFMSGSKAVTVTSSTSEVVVDVRRDVARVDLVNAPSFSGQASGGVFNAAYLINVPKAYSATATVTAAANAWNFGNAVATASEQDALLKLTAAGTVYGMPNTTAEAAAIDGTDYVTKLVIKATVNGAVYWYPIGIPGMGSNKRYVVENVYIKGVGSDEPNQYVDNKVLTTSVNVLDWDDATLDGSYYGDLLKDMSLLSTPLSFEAIENNTKISLLSDHSTATSTVEISTDNGHTWISKTSSGVGVELATLQTGETMLVRGNNAAKLTYDMDEMMPLQSCIFDISGKVSIYGNLMSLIDATDFASMTTLSNANALDYIFGSFFTSNHNASKITSHSSKELYCLQYYANNHDNRDSTSDSSDWFGDMFAVGLSVNLRYPILY